MIVNKYSYNINIITKTFTNVIKFIQWIDLTRNHEFSQTAKI